MDGSDQPRTVRFAPGQTKARLRIPEAGLFVKRVLSLLESDICHAKIIIQV